MEFVESTTTITMRFRYEECFEANVHVQQMEEQGWEAAEVVTRSSRWIYYDFSKETYLEA